MTTNEPDSSTERKPRQIVRPSFVVAFVIVVLVAVPTIGWRICWRSPPFYTRPITVTELPAPIMSYEAFGDVVSELDGSYIVTFNTGDDADSEMSVESDLGSLVLFGASHTRDPNDPQMEQIRDSWRDLQPTITLVEGRLGFLIEWFMDPVEHLGEGGLVNQLARQDGVPVYSWEMGLEREVELMLENHIDEQVALFVVLRPYFSNLRHGKPDDPNAFVEPYRAERTRISGLEQTLPNIETIDRIWQRDFADMPDWRDTSDEFGLPGYLQKLAHASGNARDEHLARLIVQLVQDGERVFVIAGSSHAVRLEPVVRAVSIDQ